MLYYKYLLVAAVFLLPACSISVPRDGDFDKVQQLVNERIPQQVYWYQGGEADERVRAKLNALLREPLTAASAVQVALLNNRDLQTEFENLGIAQADLVQAGLLSNPVLFASVRFPKGGEGGNNLEFEIAKEFLDILLRPVRQRVAETEFEKTKLRVASNVLDMVADVQDAFYKVQSAQQAADVQSVSARAAATSYELAREFDRAGNLSPLELARERSASADMQAGLIRAETRLQSARDELNTLLGLVGQTRDWDLGEKLQALPEDEPDYQQAEENALARRYDLAAAEKHVTQLDQALEMTRDYRYIGGANFGVSTEREPDGGRVTGPHFSVELPIFDQRQAEIARLESLQAQAQSSRDSLELSIRNQVHKAIQKVRNARKLTEYYRDELLPAREAVVRYTQQEQNYMLADVFELLFARRQENQAYRDYIDALSEYWTARAELAHVTGTGLPQGLEDSALSNANQPHGESMPH